MPPLPAIRTPAATPNWTNVKLYGDEGFTNFFRRLTFSPDGGLLMTPAGQFEDPSFLPRSAESTGTGKPPSSSGGSSVPTSSSSSVFIYTRANFARPPVAHLPGHKTPSIAVRFSPVLYELRAGVTGPAAGGSAGIKKVVIEKGKDQDIELDLGAIVNGANASAPSAPTSSASSASASNGAATQIHAPTPRPPSSSSSSGHPPEARPPPSPAPSASSRRAATPLHHPQSHSQSQSQVPGASGTASVFALPYRMLFAVATQDTVMIYDTQQSGPICMFTNLHYAAFTDVAWAPDGQSLMLASSDGYCSIVIFDEFLPLYHTQQHHIQMQALANSVSTPLQTLHALPGTGAPLPGATSSLLLSSNGGGGLNIVAGAKRSEPSADDEGTVATGDHSSVAHAAAGPSASTSASATASTSAPSAEATTPSERGDQQPKKKKRRIAPTHLGGIDSA
ncbi:hypothetical protein DL93DRAFT_2070229 [Clavulina sp. PMI_390]|nr:hypothetical protein DL93DRAFT_2070229 [Clavulina sp. PMI_390]